MGQHGSAAPPFVENKKHHLPEQVVFVERQ